MPSNATVLPLSDALRDLAILRASDINLSELSVQKGTRSHSDDATEGDEQRKLVAKSYEFVREARAAMRALHRGDVEKEGGKVDDIRTGLEEMLNGLET
ncbi:hypothetical protein BD410DRAFT_716267 [Rickenella mellea]|uniref:Uncharacterized protein n=1 Tax=Rickenella mellea TaxID=50990 RepID=A0A4Y7QGR6_9AGAM|nr:hypothetical protein BD410DRAFT_716267 [Rickenella mellea]